MSAKKKRLGCNQCGMVFTTTKDLVECENCKSILNILNEGEFPVVDKNTSPEKNTSHEKKELIVDSNVPGKLICDRCKLVLTTNKETAVCRNCMIDLRPMKHSEYVAMHSPSVDRQPIYNQSAIDKSSGRQLQPNQNKNTQKPEEVRAKSSTGIDEKLKKLKELNDKGLITETEYQTQREKILEDFRKSTPQYVHVQRTSSTSSASTSNNSAGAGSNKTAGTIIELIGIGIVVYFAIQLYKGIEVARNLSQLVGERAAYKLVEGKISELLILAGVGIIVFIVGAVVYRK